MTSVGKLKTKKCKACQAAFVPARPLQKVCCWQCAAQIAPSLSKKMEAKQKKEARQELRVAKEKIKTRREWLKDAEFSCHAYIRFRDRLLGCVSCGKQHTGQFHAGHFMAAGKRPALRFDESNIHRQCAQCNLHLRGNVTPYRQELLRRIGPKKVEWLEGMHEHPLWSIDEIIEIRDHYRKKLKQLKIDAGEGSHD